jgi:hypothetical protein
MVSEERRERRPNTDFEMIGIRRGDVLALIDRPEETCVVVELNPPQVAHRGHLKSLTEACNDAYDVQHNDPAGAWAYGTETLRQRRERFETYHSG